MNIALGIITAHMNKPVLAAGISQAGSAAWDRLLSPGQAASCTTRPRATLPMVAMNILDRYRCFIHQRCLQKLPSPPVSLMLTVLPGEDARQVADVEQCHQPESVLPCDQGLHPIPEKQAIPISEKPTASGTQAAFKRTFWGIDHMWTDQESIRHPDVSHPGIVKRTSRKGSLYSLLQHIPKVDTSALS